MSSEGRQLRSDDTRRKKRGLGRDEQQQQQQNDSALSEELPSKEKKGKEFGKEFGKKGSTSEKKMRTSVRLRRPVDLNRPLLIYHNDQVLTLSFSFFPKAKNFF